MKNHEHKIVEVLPDSPCSGLGIEAGDVLLSVNGRTIIDILDYRFEEAEEELTLAIRHPDGTTAEYTVSKDEDEEIGLVFAESLMDDYRSCRNKCIFCFIDQMPPGMRPTLYFKDDDTRLSFLQGNYVTLTNVSDEELDRICYYKLSPINVSVHTTNPELRCKMLHRNASSLSASSNSVAQPVANRTTLWVSSCFSQKLNATFSARDCIRSFSRTTNI